MTVLVPDDKFPMIKTRIEENLRAAFSPSYLEVIDESNQHRGHGGYNPLGESDLSVTIVSPAFCGQSRVEQHKLVYACLEEELKTRVHALRLKTLCPEEESPAVE